MVDLMHYHYTIGVDELHFRLGFDAQIEKFAVPRLTSLIREVRWDQRVCKERGDVPDLIAVGQIGGY